jgi:hypothetical protein
MRCIPIGHGHGRSPDLGTALPTLELHTFSMPSVGIILMRKLIVVSFGRQQIEQPATARAGKHATCQPVRGVPESAWSPDAKKPARGVHRSPRGLVLSLLFLVKTSVSD